MSLQELKSAAMKVQLEESADNMNAFIEAAEDIAKKHGLDSPSKHKSTAINDWVEDVEKSVDNDRPPVDPGTRAGGGGSSSQTEAARIDSAADALVSQAGGASDLGRDSPTVDDAVSALAAQMGVELKMPSAAAAESTADENEAANRLLAPHTDDDFNDSIENRKKKGVKFGGAKSATELAKDRDQIRYLSMRKSLDSRADVAASTTGGSNIVVITRRSKVSKLIERGGPRTSASFKTDSQEMMFREMRVVDDATTAKKKKHRKLIITGGEAERATALSNRLSTQTLKSHKEPSTYDLLMNAGKKKGIDEREKTYSRFDDAKECTFHPKVRKNASTESNNNDDDRGPKKSNFVERQEAAERGRVGRLELDMGKAEYDALLDKKFCPQCKAKQSYDDIKEKRKRCNNCNIEYTTTIQWNKVKKDFYERQQGMLDGMDKKRQALAEELEREKRRGTRTVYDRRRGKIVVKEINHGENESKWDEDMEHDFFTRKEKMEQNKQMHLKRIEDEMYAEIGSKSTAFDSSGNDFYDSGIGGSSLFGLDAATAFLHRYEEDVKRRNAIKAAIREEERERKMLFDRAVDDDLCDHPSAFRV